jgi:small-conductance mechanosensitive channel
MKAVRWWQSPLLHSAAAVLIAVTAGLALAIGLSLVALALASAGHTPPPLLLSVSWSAAAAVSFSSSLAYLLVHPRRPRLLRIASLTALAMLFSVAVLVLRNG